MSQLTMTCLLLVAVALRPALGQGPVPFDCGSLDNAYGPYDYTNAVHRRERLPIVEQYHFTADVSELRRGVRNDTPLADLEYTLRAFPNHHLALEAMARLHRRTGTDQLRGGRYSLPCWFKRARSFSPTDGVVAMIYGIHLFQMREFKEAEQWFHEAVALMPGSAEAHYNLGLARARLGDYTAARESAERAYEMGFPLPGLREQLRRVGEWPESE